MLLKIKGYKIIETINLGIQTVIYRARQEADEKPVLLKTHKNEYPTLAEITRLKQTYQLTKDLDIPEAVKCLKLENNGRGVALVFEDFGGISLKQYMAVNSLDLKDFFHIGIQLASGLGKLHSRQIVHKDIKPHNIIVNPATLEAKITDFSIASRLQRETAPLSHPLELEGTLAYMSPEQTGRMNRALDYRSDFYSLGVTFYEMLAGCLPFDSTDPLELVHAHIAKTPRPPRQQNPEVPEALSALTMKLLAKTAEERYQSAAGLQHDLENCLMKLSSTGAIVDFVPGKRDSAGQLLIPQKLYGREAEVTQLMEAFSRVAEGSTEMILVSGYSGIGKSVLVREVHKPIVQKRGYFIAGKFDQFERDVPYASLIQAFESLISQLLTEGEEQLRSWQEKLLEALGANGQVIIDAIPSVERIIGCQPEVPFLGPTESQNRFNRTFQQFIRVFAAPSHPLVIFLDDLQWADRASLKLIELLLSDANSQYLLLIGAYRDNEVSPTHPLIQTIEKINQSGAKVNNIVLSPLGRDRVSQLVADTLNADSSASGNRIAFFANLLFNKTRGNPFFLTQLLGSLYQDSLLVYDYSSGQWQWDIGEIQAVGIVDYNVVELIARNIQKLSEPTQKVLKLAACIGNQFNLEVLAIVNQKTQAATAADLWEALQSGLILPLSQQYKIPLAIARDSDSDRVLEDVKVDYKFLHDRVQQAAYALIPESEKKQTHLTIGHNLLQNTSEAERQENIFALVNQLNFGVDLLADSAEKKQLASLNLIAARKAKAATAHQAALKYCHLGLALLAEDSWQSQYDLTLALYTEAIEAEYLNTNIEKAEALGEVILQQTNKSIDAVKVYEIKTQIYLATFEMPKAVDTGLQALEMLGLPLAKILESDRSPVVLPSLEELPDLPAMTDPEQLAAMRLLVSIVGSATSCRPEIVFPVVLTQVNRSIAAGHSALATFAYSWYGMLLCGAGEIEQGYRAGQIAIELLDLFEAKSLKCQTYNMFNTCIRPWKEHVKESLEPLLEALSSALEVGNTEYAGYCADNYCNFLFWIGENLSVIERKQLVYANLMRELKNEYSLANINLWRQLFLNLQGLAGDTARLVGESFDEEAQVPQWQANKIGWALFNFHVAKGILLYFCKDYAGAVANTSLAVDYAKSVGGLMSVAVNIFYYSLSLLASYPEAGGERVLPQVEANQEKMRHWADCAPTNYQHKYDLVEAEKARVLGRSLEAMEYYDRAIAGAREQGYIQEEALANELAGEFYLSLGREKIAKTYMTDACYGYMRWGAIAIVKDLEERHPDLISRSPQTETPLGVGGGRADFKRATATATTTSKKGVLDLATAIKAAGAISSEIVLADLLDVLMKIVLENAGATGGKLLLEKDGELLVQARASSGQITVLEETSIAETEFGEPVLPRSVLNYAVRTQSDVVLNDASSSDIFDQDPYIIQHRPKSLLCCPIVRQGKLIGILYLENNLVAGAFTSQRLQILKIISSQAAISLENARLYASLSAANAKLESYNYTLEQKVAERTLELNKAHSQMIQSEKMSALGQLVAGIAHEINNPIGFISGNLTHTSEYLEMLLELIRFYREQYPDSAPKIQEYADNDEIEFALQDLPKVLQSMRAGADRIRDIVKSLRTFSRLDEASLKPVDLHAGIESTLLILQSRLNAAGIEVVKEFGTLPAVECYAAEMNQVFLNLLSNAIDALEDGHGAWGMGPSTGSGGALGIGNGESAIGHGKTRETSSLHPTPYTLHPNLSLHPTPYTLHPSPCPTIRIRTELLDGERVVIRIADNGPGMSQEVRDRLFDPFFTTKPVGSGTGLGLTTSYQIVVEKHQGSLDCTSAPREGANFVISIPVSAPR